MNNTCVQNNLGITFSNPEELLYFENLCKKAYVLEFYFEAVIRRVLYILIFILTIVSLLGNIKENYKWIVLNAALVTLIFTILFEITAAIPPDTPYSAYPAIVTVPYPYVNRVSIGSLLPLAMNRFFRLYFPKVYEKYLGGVKIFVFIFIIDLLLCLYAFLQVLLSYSMTLELIYNLFIMISSIALSVLLLIKLRQMNKLAQESTFNYHILKDLKRAGIVCCTQAVAFLIYLSIVSITQSFYITVYTKPRSEIPNILIAIVLVVNPFYTVLYMLWMLLDTCLFLFVLKTYRNGLAHIVKMILPESMKVNSIMLFVQTRH